MAKKCKGIWIPIELCKDDKTNWMEKMFFRKIAAMNKEGTCFASNKFFGDFFKVSPSRASEIINSLIKKDYIKANYEKNGKEIQKRVLDISKGGIRYSEGGYSENTEGNNTVINNIYSHWNKKGILVTHTTSAVRRNIQKRHRDIVSEFGEEGVIKAIDNYAEVISSADHYFSYKWPLWDFLTRGVDKFIDSAEPLTNFLKDKREVASQDREYLTVDQLREKGMI